MIIRLCEDQPKLALRISQPGCSGGQLMGRGVVLNITSAACPGVLKSPLLWCGCFADTRIKESDCCNVPELDSPSLQYPAFDVDEEGRVVFYFDKKLWSLPGGRYRAILSFRDGGVIDTFDLDLCNRPLVIDQVAVTDAKYCGDDKC